MRFLSELTNAVLAFLSFNFSREKSWSFPTVFAIETTSICNLNCIMCPRDKLTRPKVHMDPELFSAVAEQIGNRQRRALLHLGGEPLLHPHITEMIGKASAAGLRTMLSTNGTVMTEKLADGLLSSGLDEFFYAIDSTDPATYESIRRGSNLQKVLANLELLTQRQRELGSKRPRIRIQKVSDLENPGSDEEFVRYWQSRGYEVFLKQLFNWDNVLDVREKRNNERVLPCFPLWYSCVILADGSVAPCCVDYDGQMILGNVAEHSLEEIWNSSSSLALRRQHLRRDFNPVCRQCCEFQLLPSALFPLRPATYKKIWAFLTGKYT